MDSLPGVVQKAFLSGSQPKYPEEILWREVALRATLDAFGFTGSTDDPAAHNRIIREARIWFRMSPDAEAVFGMANVDLYPVRQAVLGAEPRYKEPKS